MHLDDEQIQRLLHGELVPGRESTVRAHLASCAPCSAQLETAAQDEREMDALLRHLDHPLPHVDPRALMFPAPAQSRAPRWGRWAAGIVLALGLGSASYAIPGSPLPGWIDAVVHRAAGHAQPQVPPTDADVRPGASEPAIAGISVAPGLNTRIQLTSAHGRSRVSLSDGTEIAVRAPAGTATFTSDADGLVIHNLDPNATIEIEIPRTATRVEISVGAETVFLKDGLRVTTHVAPTSGDAYLLEFGAPGSGSRPDAP